MLRKTSATIAAAALCATSSSSALAQDRGRLEAPAGAVATVNLRVPLGGRSETRRPTVGLTVDYRYADGGATLEGRPPVRVRLADLRLGRSGVDRVELASFDLANLDRDRRLNLSGGSSKKTLLVLAMFVAGIAACILTCDSDGDSDPDSDPPTSDPPPTGT